MKTKNALTWIVGMSILPLGYGAVIGISYYRDRTDSKKTLEAQERFSELERLADVDGNNSLSKVEKDLMYKRLESNCVDALYYSVCLPWSDMHQVSFWDLDTIEKTIQEYQKN